jgi:PAS domain S-box-containing protein
VAINVGTVLMDIRKIIKMLNLSAEFLSKLPEWYKPQKNNHALFCWDIISLNGIFSIWNNTNALKDLNEMLKIKELYKWDFYFEKTYFLTNKKAAVIITDLNSKIIWVSQNFESMTGYKKVYAINNYPSFLQGKNTDKLLSEKLATDLKTYKKATSILLNYKKNGDPYLCKIEIEPIFNKLSKHTHFIAYEKEIIN